MASGRHILHVDMDAFYASVEQRDDPALRGKPLVVGGTGNRGVVAAASYESRRFGIRSAMPMREARRRCPDLLQVRPRMQHYQAVSRQLFAIFREFTPLVEGLSLDEAFLDVSASLRLFGDARRIAESIKERILAETALTASVGVAPNKFVAKIASDLDKPDGLVVVTAETARELLAPLPVESIPGIGRVTLDKLRRTGIRSIEDLRTAPLCELERVFGRYAGRMRDRANAIDDRPVVAKRNDKSISAEETFDVDLEQRSALDARLLALCERATSRMRAKHLAAGTVQLKIRQSDFTTFTRQRQLAPPSAGTDRVYAAARQLLSEWLADHPRASIRLLGVGGSDLAPAAQQDLFETPGEEASSPIDRTVDDIRGRFGSAALGRARSLKRDGIG
ncbi:MAG: DNA polymerase IV [Woeseiaceae bacterium]|nr:DNA polymerase IV [Woeseiaceae bacterium]